ncbi:hypothetical protein SDC9_57328 [bioreactor metagenome]|uniref:Uncharacterized protein n=1 Tax=bioreactor metagenome TaxID=1076179 RepID=A0A644X494_9ZZZZ
MAGLVILGVEGRVQEGEVGEQPLGGAADGELEQVVVGLAGVIIYPFLDSENLNGEDGRLAVPKASFGGKEQIFHHHAALRRGVHAVINGGEGRLSPCPGMHGIKVVDKGLHCLIGGPVGLFDRAEVGKGLSLFHLFLTSEFLHEVGKLGFKVSFAVLQLGAKAGLPGHSGNDGFYLVFRVLLTRQQHERSCKVLAVNTDKGLAHAVGHTVIKVHDGLPAVLVVLVGLDGDAAQGRVG